jgi:hypothetical protein
MDLVPSGYYDPVSRKTAKQLSRIQQQALISQAELVAREQNAAHVVARRIDNGYQLAAQTVHNATRLNRLVTEVSRDNPGLEATLRSIEESVAFAAQSIIYQYMTR